jgi:branched-chain amino acid transport system substrate-binding protein
VLYEGVNAGEKDFSALISKLKSTGADYLYWGGLHTEGGLIVRQMRDQGLKTVLISGDGITTDEFATIGGPGVEGTLMTFPPDPQKRPEAAAVLKKFEARKFKPEAYTLYSYAAVQIMAEGAKRANSLDPKKVAAALHGGQAVDTVIGKIAFDKKGDITRPDYTVYTWKKGADGKITYVEN